MLYPLITILQNILPVSNHKTKFLLEKKNSKMLQTVFKERKGEETNIHCNKQGHKQERQKYKQFSFKR